MTLDWLYLSRSRSLSLSLSLSLCLSLSLSLSISLSLSLSLSRTRGSERKGERENDKEKDMETHTPNPRSLKDEETIVYPHSPHFTILLAGTPYRLGFFARLLRERETERLRLVDYTHLLQLTAPKHPEAYSH